MALGRFSYVTLDATGTLLRPKHSVAAVYVDFFMPTLNALKEANVSVGIVSNFDDRLHGIVRDLELASAVDFVLTSWEYQSMKPHPSIFHEAARRLHCRPHELLHVGDDPTNDYCGAVAAGCSVRLLCRNNNGTVDPSVPIEHVVTSLLDIVPSKERGRQD
ncbi:hypothetical protein DYB37_004924 [Aphanomyces astaci]|uniref:Uncharacterized protein n=1 Tax=Aphanomyces astaci TaxID=112090 RepID=A0A397EHW5_APHAT|nr:hypothetical protein DYB31_002467 [Aphanomyces astaci]RHY92143.1 hypothetical protein DYB35_004036 [Aphanomyces astaci]RHZ25960.1 hypothetical protein DYB37_004924 [Aphanomyces astaci]